MHNQKWVKVFMMMALTVIFLFAAFNYTIDPLWTFNHSNRYNNAQVGFDERQLKTNRAYFGGLEQYDALMLGSSRTTYINQHDFKKFKVFNYSSSSMYPNEYSGWINIAKAIKGGDFKVIIIGVDFWGSNAGSFAQGQKSTTPSPASYLNTTKSFFYRYQQLFSKDTLDWSIESIKHTYNPDATDYSRDNVKSTIKISPQRKQEAVNFQTTLYATQVYGKAYKYDTMMAAQLEALKKENPHTKFIIFTTPISKSLFEILVRSGSLPDYERWVTQLVDTFDEVYDFMGLNTITTHEDHYTDLHHFYPYIGALIADRITQIPSSKLPDDFGIRVTKENLQSHLATIRNQIEKNTTKATPQ